VPGAFDEALARLQSFAPGGAHCGLAPGNHAPAVLGRLVAEAGAPLNALIPFGSELTLGDAAAIGVRRVSVGGSIYGATMGLVDDLVRQALTTGSFATERPRITGDALTRLLPG